MQGDWVWGATGESLTYKNWAENEPNNCGNDDCVPEANLAYFNSYGFGWNDFPGEGFGSYICEWEE